MDIGEPPSDPFAGMTHEERKRSQETMILEMAYDLSWFHHVNPRERPDFALTNREGRKAFGVEITQLFINESQARLNMIASYLHRLWSGGSHLHKKDIETLKSTTVKVTDEKGIVRYTDLPAVIMEIPNLTTFRSGLYKVIRAKTARRYNLEEFTHVNLVILDWFRLDFNASDYSADRFFDDDVRTALRECPFHEVLLITYNTASTDDIDSDGPTRPDIRIIPLQQLLAMERFYITGHIINDECGDNLSDVAELNRLIIDHVSRIQGYGEPVEFDKRPFLRYRGTLIELQEQGMNVRDFADFEAPTEPAAVIPDRIDRKLEDRIAKKIGDSRFECGFSRPGNYPSLWNEG
jgi:hypothetical protein